MSPNISPIRLVVINLLVLSLLATLVGRLWYIQVLTGGEAQAVAERTSLRFVYEQAPRGFIFDREGRTVARNRTALTVALDVSRVPADQRDRLVRDLARVLDMDETQVQEIVDDPRIPQHVPRPVALDVDKDVVVALRERPERFPGVSHLEIPVREYPLGALAAHVVGHIGQIEADELEDRQERAARAAEEGRTARSYRAGDLVGKLGVERVYEDWLAGREGVRRIAVNVRGEPVEESVGDPPQRGWDAILTIDANVQAAAEDALEEGVAIARGLIDPDTGNRFEAPAGAVVALDPRNGEVLALASFPDFDPNMFVGRSDPGELAALFAEEAHQPFLNRAIAAAVPPGSTFKPFTAVAAWDLDDAVPDQTWFCPGHFQLGNRVFRDWTPQGHGTVGLSRGLAESCDIVFYSMGRDIDAHDFQSASRDQPQHLQKVARDFGFGRVNEIDLRGERQGLVPDEEWKWNRFSYAQTIDRRWFAGDNVNLSIGQGFLQVTPLQLASAYAAIANGGTVYRPRVLKCVAQLDVSRQIDGTEACADGVVPRTAAPKVISRVEAPPGALRFMEDAMVGTQVGSGTAASAFAGFPFDRVFVSGKTGTAQSPQQPFSWFAATARAGGKEIVVVAMVEEAGTGSQIAAPIGRRIIERHFGLEQATFEVGARTD